MTVEQVAPTADGIAIHLSDADWESLWRLWPDGRYEGQVLRESGKHAFLEYVALDAAIQLANRLTPGKKPYKPFGPRKQALIRLRAWLVRNGGPDGPAKSKPEGALAEWLQNAS